MSSQAPEAGALPRTGCELNMRSTSNYAMESIDRVIWICRKSFVTARPRTRTLGERERII